MGEGWIAFFRAEDVQPGCLLLREGSQDSQLRSQHNDAAGGGFLDGRLIQESNHNIQKAHQYFFFPRVHQEICSAPLPKSRVRHLQRNTIKHSSLQIKPQFGLHGLLVLPQGEEIQRGGRNSRRSSLGKIERTDGIIVAAHLVPHHPIHLLCLSGPIVL